jgi:sugar O-acyltransferase (sialic acid O-acetyltransferase NeuD family)
VKRRLLVIGAGGHCRSLIESIESTHRYEIAGMVGLENEVGQSILGYRVLGSDHNLQELVSEIPLAVVAVGQIGSAALRIRAYDQLMAKGAELATVVASTATVSRYAEIGAGSVVMHGAIINAGARIGVNCIINSRALIEHDAVVGDHCHVSTAAVLNGGASLGRESFLGSGSITHQCVRIGDRCVIGAGVIVGSDVESNSVVRYLRAEDRVVEK